jgi:hypothetical protein
MYKSYGASKIIELILEVIPREGPVILDAIHNPQEWFVVKNTFPKSMLIGVFTPQVVRSKRNNPPIPRRSLLFIKRLSEGFPTIRCVYPG